MENRTSVCARTAALDVQHRAQEAGAVSWHRPRAPEEEKKKPTHTHTKEEGGEQKKRQHFTNIHI